VARSKDAKKKAEKKKAKKEKARATKARRETPMSERAKDLKQIEDQLRDLNTEMNGINQKFLAYDREVTETIREICTEAGIWDEVNGIDMERAKVRQQANQQLQSLQEKAVDLQKIRNFLLQREAGMEPKEILAGGPPIPPKEDKKPEKEAPKTKKKEEKKAPVEGGETTEKEKPSDKKEEEKSKPRKRPTPPSFD